MAPPARALLFAGERLRGCQIDVRTVERSKLTDRAYARHTRNATPARKGLVLRGYIAFTVLVLHTATSGGNDVAKKSEPKKTSPKRRQPKPSQPNAITIRGSAEWREWLNELAGECETTPTGAIARGLAELAESKNFRKPPRRI